MNLNSMLLGKISLNKHIEAIEVAFSNNPSSFIESLVSREYDENLLSQDKIIYDERKIKLPILTTNTSNKTKGDFDNAVKLYEAIGNIDLDEANDPRLWVFLATKYYPSYIKRRHAPKTPKTIKEYYFFGSGSATSNVSNAISKLWWGVHQTVQNEYTDPKKKYLYTKMYFQFTDIVQAIGERKDIFKHRDLTKAILEIAYEKPVPPAQAVRILSKLILNHIKTTNIDFMSYDEIKELVNGFYEHSKRYLKTIDQKYSFSNQDVMNEI